VLARLEAGAPLALPSSARADAGPGDRFAGEGPGVNGAVVAVQQGHLLGTAFHPELTPTAFHPEATADERFHRYFLDMAAR
jgi:hypothetical protein